MCFQRLIAFPSPFEVAQICIHITRNARAFAGLGSGLRPARPRRPALLHRMKGCASFAHAASIEVEDGDARVLPIRYKTRSGILGVHVARNAVRAAYGARLLGSRPFDVQSRTYVDLSSSLYFAERCGSLRLLLSGHGFHYHTPIHTALRIHHRQTPRPSHRGMP